MHTSVPAIALGQLWAVVLNVPVHVAFHLSELLLIYLNGMCFTGHNVVLGPCRALIGSPIDILARRELSYGILQIPNWLSLPFCCWVLRIFYIFWMWVCVHVNSVTQSYPTLCNTMGCSLPGSSVHEIPQERILEWVALLSSMGSFAWDWNCGSFVSGITGRFFIIEPPRKPPAPPGKSYILNSRPFKNIWFASVFCRYVGLFIFWRQLELSYITGGNAKLYNHFQSSLWQSFPGKQLLYDSKFSFIGHFPR